MIRTFSICICILSSAFCFSSNINPKYSITGKVIDSLTQKPLSYATVSISQNDVIIDGVITNEKGEFKLNVQKGDYILKAEFLSYNPFLRSITVDESLDLGIIKLSESVNELEEVIIRSERSTIDLKIDKKVFNVGKDLLAQNGSLQQILENVPSVSVDLNGVVSLRGNSNVSILINGKPSVLAVNNNLNQIPSDQIDRIEVITNPSSRYQAAGTAGIINVILKKNGLEGLSGSLTLTNSIIANTSAYANINYKTNMFNLFSTVGYRFTDSRVFEDVSQNSTSGITPLSLDRKTEEYHNLKRAYIYTGFDYFLSASSTLTASYFKILAERDNVLRYDYTYFSALPVQTLNGVIVRDENYFEPIDHNQLEVSYTKNYNKKGKKLLVDFQYDFWNEDENEDFLTRTIFPPITESITASRTKDIESSKDFLLQIDFVNPIHEKTTFETGFRGETRIISSDYKAEIFQNNQWEIFNSIDNKLDYRERIVGVYALYANEQKKFNYQLGIRAEYTNIDVSDRNEDFGSKKNYTQLFPTIHLNYVFSDVTTTQLSYSRRINRPSFWQLNPFSTLSGGLNAQIQGNPDLDPSFTSSLEFGFLTKIGKLKLNPSIYYQHTTDPFQFFTAQNADDILISTTINLDTEKRIGGEISLSYNPLKWLQVSGDVNYYSFQQRGNHNGVSFDFNNKTWTSRVNSRIKLPRQITFQATFNYNARNENAQTITKPYYFGSIGINKPFLKNKAAVTFNIRNVLNSRDQRIFRTGENFTYESSRRDFGPIYMLTFTYRFNQKENSRTRRPGRSNR
ncbi:outer membrane beta-barrel family protein [uncultured Psychroserpens sp.]|uniref:outer membrane beta-barrel family protein n=1 Tax=uncultured Psychroserpens sp. TaxID=255436 RepID=UPI002615029B|nr:outer membrane beta-barrel family protein [uncultured Psychroserpens sp.]